MNSNLFLVILGCCVAATLASSLTDSVPRCDLKIIEAIKKFWKKEGVPQDVLKAKGTFNVVESTNSSVYIGVKCWSFEFKEGGFIEYNVDGVKSTTIGVEDAGIVAIPGSKGYILNIKNGLYVSYRCSCDGPIGGPPLATIATTELANTLEVVGFELILKGLGLEVNKTFSTGPCKK